MDSIAAFHSGFEWRAVIQMRSGSFAANWPFPVLAEIPLRSALLDSVGGLGIRANRFLILRSYYFLDTVDITYSRWIFCYLFASRFELIWIGCTQLRLHLKLVLFAPLSCCKQKQSSSSGCDDLWSVVTTYMQLSYSGHYWCSRGILIKWLD